ncbi:MAG: lytic transglycosylase domain-containing protein [bacterium]|nr:lytic transglycosylase domain-containing protein [bacterium]
MTSQELLSRSYRTNVAYDILRRSTARVLPVRSPKSPEKPKSLPKLIQNVQASVPPVVAPSIPENTPQVLPAPSELHPQVLSRLEKYDTHIERYSKLHGISPNLVRALIYVESAGDPSAESSVGAQGLMQLMPNTASGMGVSNAFDPAQNIFGGARYISTLIDRFERIDLALWAYNAGPEAVKNKRLPMETKRFIPEVLRIKSILDRSGS